MRWVMKVAAALSGFGIFLSGGICRGAGGDGPSVAKDSIQVTCFTEGSFHGDYTTWSWVPRIEFRLNGPIVSGDQVSVEFKTADGTALPFDCKTEVIEKGHYKKIEGGGGDLPAEKGVTATGAVNFTIALRNELAGTHAELFSGHFTVAKVHSNETAPNCAQHFVYYSDQDWNLPIGYVYFTKDSVEGMKLPTLNVAFWARGAIANDFEPHLFYKGKEVGVIRMENMAMGAPSCKADVNDGPTREIDGSLPQKGLWSRIACTFPNVKAWDKRTQQDQPIPRQKGERHLLKGNPGEYELKVLRQGHLARSIKFTVNDDGKADDAITIANQMGDDRAIVPVQILGDLDGPWNKDAWKTEAFYGHPLTGFTAVP